MFPCKYSHFSIKEYKHNTFYNTISMCNKFFHPRTSKSHHILPKLNVFTITKKVISKHTQCISLFLSASHLGTQIKRDGGTNANFLISKHK